MSVRYKIALLSLASLAMVYGWYFADVISDHGTAVHGDPTLRLVAAVLLLVIAQIVGNILIVATSRDRWEPMDERERGFDRRATSTGYYMLIVGTLLAAATIHIGAHAHDLANAVLLAIVLAECARQAVFLILHHRAA